jgi:hypothetical protein
VEKRPESLITEAMIVFFHITPGKVDRITAKLRHQFSFEVFLISFDFFSRNSRPPYPYAAIVRFIE